MSKEPKELRQRHWRLRCVDRSSGGYETVEDGFFETMENVIGFSGRSQRRGRIGVGEDGLIGGLDDDQIFLTQKGKELATSFLN